MWVKGMSQIPKIKNVKIFTTKNENADYIVIRQKYRTLCDCISFKYCPLVCFTIPLCISKIYRQKNQLNYPFF